ncbi:MAG: hypothetical protein ACLRNC_16470, partial [Gemmiger formicilis]|uniref:hypothetical protein n=1 Tax=Gemmiger formicilis TaxID=745368 RepID=UPI003A47CF0D
FFGFYFGLSFLEDVQQPLFVLHGFYGAVKERIRTACAPRFASRGAETPRWGVSRARLGESLRVRQKAHCNVLLQCAFFQILE